MGPAHARAASEELAREAAGGLLVLGFCGGLDEASVPGEAIVAEEVYAVDGEDRPAERVACTHTHELVASLAGRGMKVRSGKIVCVSRLALGERRARLHEDGAIAVDMESVWLAPAAGERPFAVVRVVLDSPSHELLRPQAAVSVVRAARALRRVAGALHEWSPRL
jgi:4-hydroxy-3-methylbut-2-enyl diphosphate reductase